ncbi:hypothetical protein FCH28_17840 [Streptomyces piniterrae]|uniref:Uncharacterized protein n=1 Tax=Streptomyces piniterrae TaxID=2571125 RepID=A0A4U0NFY0_9ACTN|nr:hypothetical protein [Streptomyces piniterrae]TJZ53019.1 hypothetical protein FCH28_17840 [Streptomyces piniterrae]
MATADERGRGIHIGSVQGAFAIGDNNTVTNHQGSAAPATDPAQEELLRAVRALRDDLARVVETPEVTALTAQLADTEGEIAETGAAGPGRLARLRTALADAGSVVGLLASGAAVGQAVAALAGG